MTTHELADKQDDKQNRYVNAPGKYIAKVKLPGNGWIVTTTKGTDFIRIPLLIDEPASDQHGREIVWQGWLSEKATRRTVQTLDAAFGKNWTIASLESGLMAEAVSIAPGSITNDKLAANIRFLPWVKKTANYTASAGDRIFADTSAGAFTVTLPAAPAQFDTIILTDIAESWPTNKLTIARNAKEIENTAEDLLCDVSAEIVLRYEGETRGWRVFAYGY